MRYRIGIDVGGTNTDAAILDENLKVITSTKVATTEDVETGIYNVLNKIINKTKISPKDIKYAMLGSTHCTNAIVERKNLNSVATIHIAKPATTAIIPFTDWDEELKKIINFDYILVSGGFEFNGELINELNKKEIVEFCKKIKDKVESVAISGVFSPVNNEQEVQVAQWIKEELGDIQISLSSEIGNIGLLERENAAILNSALHSTSKKVAYGFKNALLNLGIDCNIYLSQNDGTLMSFEQTLKFPIFTIGCGITNSIRGASFLSGIKDAIILDIGGTTTDIGVLQEGFPRESQIAVTIGGVRTNFRMPDMISIGIAGGTKVIKDGNNIKIGPQSVGYKITEEAIIYDGSTLTLSDIATYHSLAFPEFKEKVNHLEKEFCDEVYKSVALKLEDAIDQMKTKKGDVPIVLTGGGSIICPKSLKGVSEIIKPEHYKSANAVGAALGQVSGEIEKVYNLDKMTRKEALKSAVEDATEKAIHAGAIQKSITILSQEDTPLAYLPGNATLIKVKVIGELF